MPGEPSLDRLSGGGLGRSYRRARRLRRDGETQSALTVEGDGPSFYFWATPLTAPADELAADEGWRTLGRSAGVDVYGDPGLWRWWTVQEQILWVKAGATEGARLPTLAELAPLIRASRQLAAPVAP